MTTPKKGIYYYLVWLLFLLNIPNTILAAQSLKELSLHHMIASDYVNTIRAVFSLSIQFYFLSEIFRFKEGYTIISTTKYNLFKCRESGKEETFMMFADNEEELEKFFDYTRPNKKMFIESAEMTGQSIQMKIFNGANE